MSEVDDLWAEFEAAKRGKSAPAGAPGVATPAPTDPDGLSAASLWEEFETARGARRPSPAATPPPPAPSHPVAKPTGSLTTDIPRIAGTTGTNILAGMAATPNLIAQGVDWLGERVGLNPGAEAALSSIPAPGSPNQPAFPNPAQAKEMAYATTGATEFQPESWLGRRGMDAAAGAALGLLSGLRSIPAMIGGSITGGGLAEEAEKRGYSPIVGALLGSLPGAYAGRWLGNRPLPAAGGRVGLETAQLADAATDRFGIPIAPGQMSNNRFINSAYSEGGRLPFSGAEAFRNEQQGAFNRGIARTFGETADRITPEVLQRAYDRLGTVFDTAAANTGIRFDAQLGNDLSRVVRDVRQVLTPEQIAPLDNQVRNIIGLVQPGGTISGEAYQALTKRNGPLDRAMSSTNADIANYAREIRDALDDALERASPPEHVAALQQARREYRALKTAEPLTVRADVSGGPRPTEGDISPAALRGRVNQQYPTAPRMPLGQNDLNDLAKIGQRFLKEPPDSGTATRNAVHNTIGAGASLLGAGAGGAVASVPGLVAGAATPLALNRLAQSLMRNQPIARGMIERGLNPYGFQFTAPTALQRALIPPALGRSQNPTQPAP